MKNEEVNNSTGWNTAAQAAAEHQGYAAARRVSEGRRRIKEDIQRELRRKMLQNQHK